MFSHLFLLFLCVAALTSIVADEEYEVVSVSGDASYKVVAPGCFGSNANKPRATTCPKAGDVAVAQCKKKLKSYDSETKTCIAPSDAVCKFLKSGSWGCVFVSDDDDNSEADTTTPPVDESPSANKDQTPQSTKPSSDASSTALHVGVGGVLLLIATVFVL